MGVTVVDFCVQHFLPYISPFLSLHSISNDLLILYPISYLSVLPQVTRTYEHICSIICWAFFDLGGYCCCVRLFFSFNFLFPSFWLHSHYTQREKRRRKEKKKEKPKSVE